MLIPEISLKYWHNALEVEELIVELSCDLTCFANHRRSIDKQFFNVKSNATYPQIKTKEDWVGFNEFKKEFISRAYADIGKAIAVYL